MKAWLWVIFYCCACAAYSQNKLSGKVLNAITNEPVPFVNVFFANTTIGMSTREDGTFSLSGFPNGKYDITVTSIGYKQFQTPIDFTIPHKEAVEILIQENAVELNEIVVKEENPHWESDFQLFKKLFIGETSYAQKCSIENPKDIHLYFDPEQHELTAHSKNPIEVINNALGLRILYHLNSFNYDSKSGIFIVTGIPQIQYLKPKNKAEEKRWINERREAYNGSVMHFTRMLFRDSLAQAEFTVRKIYSIPNKKRLPQQLIDEGIKRFSPIAHGAAITLSANDSLAYFLRMKKKPEMEDSIAQEIIAAKQLMKDASVDYRGKLLVVYEKEKEEWDYTRLQGRTMRINQTSILNFIGQQPLKIYSNGYYENPTDLFLESYWSWAEKTPSLLPMDYQPQLDIPHLDKP